MGVGGKLKLEDGTAGGVYVGFKAPDTAVASDTIWTLPDADGSAGQLLSTDGSKNIIFVDNLDATLQANIDTEITARTDADVTLQMNIDSEATARMNADVTLQSNITAATFTSSSASASNGQTLACDTSGGAISITAPGSPSQNYRFRIVDIKGSASTNNITVLRNSSNIAGVADDFAIDINWADITFVYYDATVGWAPVRQRSIIYGFFKLIVFFATTKEKELFYG